METHWNFQAGLREAYTQLQAEGKITKEAQVVGDLCNARRGRRFIEMIRSHRAVRRYYLRSTGEPIWRRIDWQGIVDWIKAHWVDILKIILSLAIFVI